MIDIFVKPEDEIKINFCVAQTEEGRLYVDRNREGIKLMLGDIKAEVEDCYVLFRKPSFGDSMKLAEEIKSYTASADGDIKFSPVANSYKKMVYFIKDWSFEKEGEKIEPTEENICALSPVIADFVASQLEREIGSLLS